MNMNYYQLETSIDTPCALVDSTKSVGGASACTHIDNTRALKYSLKIILNSPTVSAEKFAFIVAFGRITAYEISMPVSMCLSDNLQVHLPFKAPFAGEINSAAAFSGVQTPEI